MDRLLGLARDALGADVRYLDAVAAAADPGDDLGDDRIVDVPLATPEGHPSGVLRFARRADMPYLDERDAAVLRALGHLLSAHMDTPSFERDAWQQRISRIRSLLDRGTLPIIFQPIADLRNGEVVGVEALSRFPGMPEQVPAKWFAEAASVGLGVELEILAVRQAVEILGELPEPVYLSVNVSPAAAMSPQLVQALVGVPLHRLVLEITEHAQVVDYEALNAALRRLRSQGVRLAVDDAGSGFSSLRHILRMSPDIIKLDISLTHGIDNDSVLRALGYALSSFASAIDAAVIAEGVETEREVHALRFLQVAYGQGFYLRRPGPPPLPERLHNAVFTR